MDVWVYLETLLYRLLAVMFARSSPPWFTKVQDGCEISYYRSVEDFVTAKAPDFNNFQQSSTGIGIVFGTRRPEVQILSPRPFFFSVVCPFFPNTPITIGLE